MRKFIFVLIIIMLVVSVCLNVGMYRHIQTDVVRSDTVYKEKVIKVVDSAPAVKEEKVIGQVSIPVHSNSLNTGKNDTLTANEATVQRDSVTFDVVQRKYTDDSTYTAYVSGLRYDIYPRLDSVIVRQKIIERTITNNIYRDRNGLKVKLRPSVSAGYDPLNKQWGVMLGGAVVLDW